MWSEKFKDNGGGGSASGTWSLSRNGVFVAEFECKSRSSYWGFKGTLWAEVYEDGFHIFTTKKKNTWADFNGTLSSNRYVDFDLKDNIPLEVMQYVDSPHVQIVHTSRDNPTWEEAVKAAEEGAKQLKDVLSRTVGLKTMSLTENGGGGEESIRLPY
ncbi:hypothetical protein RAH32_21050 [Paracoccus sp. WLY502]|uniref:hypothetical protein n=1 Tax=Paracoccus yibinensis TaxID=3068891 RepID=UPI002796C8A0|nr:hypothetical protein [Paracoccus sp. WLY502]MDQ1902904.1 hypothetical protein [Paracoccus sp. WLY502]